MFQREPHSFEIIDMVLQRYITHRVKLTIFMLKARSYQKWEVKMII